MAGFSCSVPLHELALTVPNLGHVHWPGESPPLADMRAASMDRITGANGEVCCRFEQIAQALAALVAIA